MKTQGIALNTHAANLQPYSSSGRTNSLVHKITSILVRFATLTICAAMLFCACPGNLMAQAQTSLLFAETPGELFTTGGNWVPITGLTLTLPPAPVGSSANQITSALVTLNVPNPYATGTDYPGGCFGISVNSAVLTTVALFYYPDTSARAWQHWPDTNDFSRQSRFAKCEYSNNPGRLGERPW